MSSFPFLINSSILTLDGLGSKSAAVISEICGGKRFADILLHIPDKIVCRKIIKESDELIDGQDIVAKVKVRSRKENLKFRSILCQIDGRFIKLIFFNKGVNNFVKSLSAGSLIWVAGKLSFSGSGLSIIHPKISLEAISDKPPREFVYSAHYSKFNSKFSEKRFSFFIAQILSRLRSEKEFCDWNLRRQNFGWPDFFQAMNILHFPSSDKCIEMRSKCIERLAYDELLMQQIFFCQCKKINNLQTGFLCKGEKILQNKVLDSLEFKLTQDQISALSDIEEDQFSNRKMFRILYGDVGSGKTLVAILSALNSIENGMQVAFLVPTEVLALQHYKNVQKILVSLNLKIECLLGSSSVAHKREVKKDLITGKTNIVIGTHALFQESIDYLNLGMIIVDEQQRFGVAQRRDMFCKNSAADILMISATPIPRTMQMIYSGFAQCSTIKNMPKSRGEIKTFIINEDKMLNSLAKLAKSEFGRKVIWICPSIEHSEEIKMASIEKRLKILQKHFNLAVLSSRVSKSEKDEILERFVDGKINMILATTVVEVGLDVKDVTCMVIDSASRFGLSQLHQCRGRVARGIESGYCFLLYNSSELSKKVIKRLKIMCENSDGFSIAEHDYKLRGSGELGGEAQSGFFGYRFFGINDADHDCIAEAVLEDIENLEKEGNLNFEGMNNLSSLFGYNDLETFV